MQEVNRIGHLVVPCDWAVDISLCDDERGAKQLRALDQVLLCSNEHKVSEQKRKRARTPSGLEVELQPSLIFKDLFEFLNGSSLRVNTHPVVPCSVTLPLPLPLPLSKSVSSTQKQVILMGLQNSDLLFGRTSPCVLAMLGRWSDSTKSQTVLYQSESLITRQLYITRGIRCRKTYVGMSKMLASIKGKRYRQLNSEVDLDSTVLFYAVLPAFRNWSLEDLVAQYNEEVSTTDDILSRVKILCKIAIQYDLSHSISEKLDFNHCFQKTTPPETNTRKTTCSCHCIDATMCIETEPDPHLKNDEPLTINKLMQTLVPNGSSGSGSGSDSASASASVSKQPEKKKRKEIHTLIDISMPFTL